jgi:hypothetical protein
MERYRLHKTPPYETAAPPSPPLPDHRTTRGEPTNRSHGPIRDQPISDEWDDEDRGTRASPTVTTSPRVFAGAIDFTEQALMNPSAPLSPTRR